MPFQANAWAAVRLVVVIWLSAFPVSGQPYNYGFDVNMHLARRHPQLGNETVPFVVEGLGRSRGPFPARQEINRLEQDPEMWTLYLLGLSMMQYMNQSQMLSYYQIAGIHGVPWVQWNGVSATPGNENTGYCNHISILFLTWHRPYLALYEQVLGSLIHHIASLYPENATRTKYETAARNFRIPYMDWAAQPSDGESVLPESVGGSPFINISGPYGPQIISNPLYTYPFNPLNASMFLTAPYDKWVTTVRSPTADNSSAGSNNTAVSLALNKNFPSFQQRLYNLLSNYKAYGNFSTEAWIPDRSNDKYDSLESLHDTIHALSGLRGHMAWIPFSSFDPIFFLHHCMVDRVFALWQILNPDSWVEPTPAYANSFTSSRGQIQDSQTPLTPFYATSSGKFWTSDGVRDISVFGYSYDDLADFPMSSLTTANTTTQAQVSNLINKLYSSSSLASLGIIGQEKNTVAAVRVRRNKWKRTQPRQGYHPSRRLASFTAPKPPPRSLIRGSRYYEWVVNIHAEKQGLDGTFFVHMFFGDPQADAASWAYAPNLVGTMSVFASPPLAMAGMDMRNSHASGTVPLTSALAQQVNDGKLTCLEPPTAEPYLRQNLKYRIVKTDGSVVAPKDVAGLGITVTSSVVQVPTNAEELPRWGEAVYHFDLI